MSQSPNSILLYNAVIVTGEKACKGSVIVCGDRIAKVLYQDNEGKVEFESCTIGHDCLPELFKAQNSGNQVIDMTNLHLFAGGIDAHAHFREPGLTHKADMESESLAACAGGITSFMDMPNTNPPTTTIERLEEKLKAAKGRCHANYGFHLGATNANIDVIHEAIESMPHQFGGVKVFMGSSTGNMLVDNPQMLKQLFSIKEKPVLVHAENEEIIRDNTRAATERYGDDIPFREHEIIRSEEACIKSSKVALKLAKQYGTTLHLLHISTAAELDLVKQARKTNHRITAETSANYLWFSDKDYDSMGSHVKCNPSIKTENDRKALRAGLKNGLVDTIGSDHAPHLLGEKEEKYRGVPSGMPSIQQSFSAVLTVAKEEDIALEKVASAMSEKPATIFKIKDRGFIREGYFADLVAFDLSKEHKVTKDELYYKCGWSPYEGVTFKCKQVHTFVNGKEVIYKGKHLDIPANGSQLIFE